MNCIVVVVGTVKRIIGIGRTADGLGFADCVATRTRTIDRDGRSDYRKCSTSGSVNGQNIDGGLVCITPSSCRFLVAAQTVVGLDNLIGN